MRSFLLSLGLIVACGQSTTTSGPEIEEVPPMLAQTICDVASDCFGPFAEVFLTTDCVGTFTAGVEDTSLPRWQASIEEGDLVYDGSEIAGCLAEIRGAGCDAFTLRLLETCGAAFDGQVAIGDACDSNDECAGDAYCELGASCPGTCATRKAAGSACVTDEECVSGTGCTDDGICGRPPGRGDSCTGDCGGGTICVGADEEEGTPGTCMTIDEVFTLEAGAECDIEGGEFCEPDLSCAVDEVDLIGGTATFVCVAESSSGGTCKVGFPDPCPTGEFCDANPDLGVFEGTCTSLPGAGQPCHDGDLGAGCAGTLQCVDGTCTAIQRLGASCGGDEECYSGNCSGGVCTEPVCLGE